MQKKEGQGDESAVMSHLAAARSHSAADIPSHECALPANPSSDRGTDRQPKRAAGHNPFKTRGR